jgi:hypothetical protein
MANPYGGGQPAYAQAPPPGGAYGQPPPGGAYGQPPPGGAYGQPPPAAAAPAPGAPYGQMSQQATTAMLLGAADINPRLRQLIEAEKANQECADCSTKNPNWASYNIGVFLCEKCCGVHRRIGTHISKPRSVDLDDWTPDHLEAMEIVGNVNAEAYWCYNVPFGRAKPEEGDAMAVITEWIQSKYERKQFCKQPGATSNERSDPGVHVYEKSGWMEKSGGAKEGGKWQPRFFELKDFKLSYYKSQPEPGKKVVAKGIIPITPQVEIRCATNMGVQGEQVQDRMIEGTGFVVRSTEGRDYNFRTETAEEVRTRHLDPARPSVAVACVSFGTKCFLSKSLSATGFICVSFSDTLRRCFCVCLFSHLDSVWAGDISWSIG